ncbi:alpha-2-macroglobulin [Pseudomonas sp. S1Bt30]|uniref:Alpha-2-macroglobulin n=1 Tax=Pseudomonas quebecensis TaxID=2995174 RepID=A0ABY6QGH6_9PSED|nr:MULTISPECIES: alpha-2-macroglobulin [Pseudomonas]MCX4063363.1 alpha-2-macroglobulin [Pseudomonas quebecensis]UZW17953.1 alpha-2-macroglobulin [Pseudomonas quebecensis]UZW24633.1 alpha-2-macroglobulin [Pseudomonas quebecensis]UZW29696.1 alpha-2-macroglobulin [Pseudomonas quebecensis]
MLNKGLFLACALALLSACDSSDKPAAPTAPAAATSTAPKPVKAAVDVAALKQRYAGRELSVVDVSEVQLDGASTLSVSFSIPLDPEQKFADKLHLVDSKSGKVDGAWELSDNLMELRLRHLEPQRKLVLTVDAGVKAVNDNKLAAEYSARLETRDLQATVGFASRGTLLPTRLAEGLPVIALNVDKIDVEFFRIKPESLPSFLAQWGRNTSLQSYESRELLPMADLVYGGRFDLNPARNTRETLLLPIAGLKQLQQPGVYLAVMRASGTYNYSQPATLFTLSDIGLSVHRYSNRLDVFTQALEGGKALNDVDLEVLDADGRVLAQGKTEKGGHAQLPLPKKAQVLLAKQGEQTSLLRLDSAALDLAEFDIGGQPSHPLQFFVFGPRDLYRPGETVLLNALLRDKDGNAVKPQPVSVEVRRPDEQVSRKFVWDADASGLYQYALQLAGEAPTGRWQLVFDLGDGKPQLYEFLVEDFLPERLALELKGSDTPLSPADSPQIQLTGRYLYGAPASGNRISGQVYVRPLREAVKSLPGYEFGSVTEEDLSQDFEIDESVLDAKGHEVLSMESKWAEAKSPLQLIVQASLHESGGRPITRRLVQPIWPAKQLPGLRGLFDGKETNGDGPAEFEVLLANQEGQKLAAPNLKVRLVRERRDYYWNYSDSDGWSYHYNEKFLNLDEQTLNIKAGDTAKVSFQVEWGPYRVEVEDPQTGLVSSLRFWAGYQAQDNTEGGAVRPDQVKLALDKPAYGDGDTANITVTPPAAGKGYLLVESAEGPLWWQEIDVPAEGKSFAVKLDPKWSRHDLYVSALVIRPGERKANITPKRAVGLLHLPLDRTQRKLGVTLTAPEKMRPKQPLKVKVAARNADGSVPKQVHVLVAAVDVGILNITEYPTPDPYASLFGRKAYGVDQFDIYGQLIEAGQGRLASLAFGGDAALAKGGKRPDTSVTIVALQSAPVTLNDKGEGEVSVNIPDFNGELRLMAQAWSDDRYGMAEARTVIAAPLVAELSAPRFLAGGDQTTLALDLSNLSGKAQKLDVQLSAEGQLELVNAGAQSVELKQGQRTTLRIPVKAWGGLGQGKLKVTVNGLDLPGEQLPPFSREWTLGVRPAYPALLKHYRAVLKNEPWSLPVGTLDQFDASGREALLSLSSRPPLNLGAQISALKAYPYGCLEQTASGLYPSLYADDALLKRLGVKGEPDAERKRKIELGIERLLGMQRYNGSFGLWGADGEEEYWLTAYVTDFLLRARDQGFAVPAEALKKASERLLRYVQERNLIDVDYSDNADHTRFAVQAYAGMVLARSQQAPLGALRSIFERRSDARSGLPLVQLAIALQKMGDQPRADQALLAGLAAQRNTKEWLADYGSPLRDQAMILALLEENDLAKGKREERLFTLSDQLAASPYLSTQERNSLFLAGRLGFAQPEANWQVSLTGSGGEHELNNQQPTLALEGKLLSGDLALSNQGDTPVYQQLTLSGYPQVPPTAGGDNLSIRREYLGMNGQPLNLRNLNSGDLVLVHVAVSAKQRVPDALVVDLLPAGLELENQNLAQSAASLENASSQVKEWRESMQNASLKHQEFRDDRYVAALNLDSDVTTHLLYLARAVTPGTYRVPPPQVESMYRPNWQAVGDTPADLVIKGR